MSNVVPMKMFRNYKVAFNRETSYVATVFACSAEDAKHMVLRCLDDQDMELMQDMLTAKGTTYTSIESVKEA
jgi:hypothetical protein